MPSSALFRSSRTSTNTTARTFCPLDQASVLVDSITADPAVQPALEAFFLVYPALCVHLWHYVCRSLRMLHEKQLRTIG